MITLCGGGRTYPISPRILNPVLRCCRAGALLLLLVCLGTSYAAAQAAAEYGGAVASGGARVVAIPVPKAESPAVPPGKSGSAVHLTARPTEDVEATNRKALEAHAGKDAAKLMLRSEPTRASVKVDGKPVGKTPLLLIVAPGVYKVDMEGLSTEVAHQQVDLLPKETREVVSTLKSRYPTHVQLRWHNQ